MGKSKSNKTPNKGRKDWHPLYEVWRNVVERTTMRSHKGYKTNESRGVTICEAWRQDFYRFVRDMGERPDGHYLKRRNTWRDYDKDNCYWAAYKTNGAAQAKTSRPKSLVNKTIVDVTPVTLDID